MLAWLMVVAADTGGWTAMWHGEMIVQTCTTEGSAGDVAKASLVQDTKPGQVRTK